MKWQMKILKQGVQGISDIIVDDALINLDFADVTTIMKDRGIVHMGVGRGTGETRLEDAVKGAINSPLLETQISGARAVLINITGGRDLTMFDVDKVASQIDQEADENAIIILGASIKEEMQDEIAVTVIAAGFEKPQDMDILEQSGHSEQTGRDERRWLQRTGRDSTFDRRCIQGNVRDRHPNFLKEITER